MSSLRVDLAYAYADNHKDAVARALEELKGGLIAEGLDARVVRPTVSKVAPSNARPLQQILFSLELACHILLRRQPAKFLILVDIPTGLTLLLRVVSILRPTAPKIVNWALDLYRSQDLAMNGSTPKRNLRRFMEVASLKSAHEVVVIGSCMQEEVRSIAKRNSQIIPIWHADVTASTKSEIDLFRADLGLTSKLMMLYSGRAGQNHPLAGLVQSFAEAQNADIDLVVVGQGAKFDEASQLAQDLALKNCHFLPPVPFGDMGKLLRAADWHVASLAVEATGTCVPSKVYASMSVGRPILFLGSADSQAALDIASACAGLVADPTDVTSLRGVIERIASDSTLAGAMGASGQHFFRKNRTVSAGAAAWAGYLKQCESR